MPCLPAPEKVRLVLLQLDVCAELKATGSLVNARCALTGYEASTRAREYKSAQLGRPQKFNKIQLSDDPQNFEKKENVYSGPMQQL